MCEASFPPQIEFPPFISKFWPGIACETGWGGTELRMGQCAVRMEGKVEVKAGAEGFHGDLFLWGFFFLSLS